MNSLQLAEQLRGLPGHAGKIIILIMAFSAGCAVEHRYMDSLYCIGICLRIEEEQTSAEISAPDPRQAAETLNRLQYWTRDDSNKEPVPPSDPEE